MIPELHRVIARSSALASFSSRMPIRRPAFVEQQPAVARRVLSLEADHHEIGALGERGTKPADRLRAQQRRVAIENDHRTGETGEGILRRLDRVGGATLLALHEDRKAGIEPAGDARNLVHAGSHDHADLFDGCGLGGREHMDEQRRPGERVHHLRRVGLHPGALAGGKDDGENRSSASCLFDHRSGPSGSSFAGSNRGRQATFRDLSNGKRGREP